MTPMLEKMVADMKAAMAADGAEWACEGHSEKAWNAVARAALLAIREPDSTMMAARIGPADEPYWYERALEADFTAMIDSILGEKPEAPPEGS